MTIKGSVKTGSPEPDPQVDPRLVGEQPGLLGMLRDFRRRVAQGDLGSLPIVAGLVVVWAYFQYSNSNFLSPGNLTNLMLQIAAVGTIAVGVVLVLLLGEIDLSVGAVSGLSAAVMAVLNVNRGVPATIAIAAGLGTGIAVGLIHGFWITRFRVPSFVVTLAGLLGWQGALLYVLGDTGTVNLSDYGITRLAGTFYSPAVGWILGGLTIAAFMAISWRTRASRTIAGLPVGSVRSFVLRAAITAGGVALALATFNADRGLPLAVVIFVGTVVLFDLLTKKTRFGRQIYAVGGNAEAARRAGINVQRVRLLVFVLASLMAAVGGILGASRLLAVNQSSGSGDLLLIAIASAVIGGTSLFGGRGTAWSALLGALVIGSISNGMDLLGKSSEVKFMVTGAALLAAATIDAVARRGRISSGRG
ncbi:MAG: sugar ABC transporter permease [Actinomycetota bacterium]